MNSAYTLITKVGYTTNNDGVTVTIHTVDDTGKALKLDVPEAPRPQFYTALQSLTPYVFSHLLGIEPTWTINNPTIVKNINYKAKDDVTFCTITLKAELSEGVDWTINTPQFCLETQQEQFATLLLNVADEAEKYLSGERAQSLAV